MSHVLVTGATAPSHTYPHLALVRELVRRGHRVTYSTGEALRPLAEATGARPVIHRSPLPATSPDDGGVWPQDPVEGMALFLDDGQAALPGVLAALADDPPDLVLHDIGGHAGPVAAHRFSVRAVQLSPAMVAWDGYDDDYAEVLTELRSSPAYAAYDARFATWYAEHGMPRSWEDATGKPEHGLVLIPKALQPNADRVGAHMRFVGPCLDPARLDEEWVPAAPGRVLLVAFGTAYANRPAVFRAAAEAAATAAGGPWHVVLAIGKHTDRAALGELPGSVEVHERVPQLAVLRHADAFVTHAGGGSASEALWFGVPAIAVPAAVDQFANADTLQALGVARHVPEAEADAATLRTALEAVTDPVVVARAAALGEQTRSAGGTARAADAVEDHLRR